ncbi:hypothetical protein IAT38_001944 [Cryptococcus sp. DSM 104549]
MWLTSLSTSPHFQSITPAAPLRHHHLSPGTLHQRPPFVSEFDDTVRKIADGRSDGAQTSASRPRRPHRRPSAPSLALSRSTPVLPPLNNKSTCLPRRPTTTTPSRAAVTMPAEKPSAASSAGKGKANHPYGRPLAPTPGTATSSSGPATFSSDVSKLEGNATTGRVETAAMVKHGFAPRPPASRRESAATVRPRLTAPTSKPPTSASASAPSSSTSSPVPKPTDKANATTSSYNVPKLDGNAVTGRVAPAGMVGFGFAPRPPASRPTSAATVRPRPTPTTMRPAMHPASTSKSSAEGASNASPSTRATPYVRASTPGPGIPFTVPKTPSLSKPKPISPAATGKAPPTRPPSHTARPPHPKPTVSSAAAPQPPSVAVRTPASSSSSSPSTTATSVASSSTRATSDAPGFAPAARTNARANQPWTPSTTASTTASSSSASSAASSSGGFTPSSVSSTSTSATTSSSSASPSHLAVPPAGPSSAAAAPSHSGAEYVLNEAPRWLNGFTSPWTAFSPAVADPVDAVLHRALDYLDGYREKLDCWDELLQGNKGVPRDEMVQARKAGFLACMRRGRLPSVSELVSWAEDEDAPTSYNGVYLKFVRPKPKSGLKTLLYIGMSTRTGKEVWGAGVRAKEHQGEFRDGTETESPHFSELLNKNRPGYRNELSIAPLFADLNPPTTTSAIFRARLAAVVTAAEQIADMFLQAFTTGHMTGWMKKYPRYGEAGWIGTCTSMPFRESPRYGMSEASHWDGVVRGVVDAEGNLVGPGMGLDKICPVCDKKFLTKGTLNKHIPTHDEPKLHCLVAGCTTKTVFKTPKDLNMHTR